jgi:hypothetical protein
MNWKRTSCVDSSAGLVSSTSTYLYLMAVGEEGRGVEEARRRLLCCVA